MNSGGGNTLQVCTQHW